MACFEFSPGVRATSVTRTSSTTILGGPDPRHPWRRGGLEIAPYYLPELSHGLGDLGNAELPTCYAGSEPNLGSGPLSGRDDAC